MIALSSPELAALIAPFVGAFCWYLIAYDLRHGPKD
jgi:hypothetical protein